MFESTKFSGGHQAVPLCFWVSLLPKVITGALNFELLKYICCAIDTNKYICRIKIVTIARADLILD